MTRAQLESVGAVAPAPPKLEAPASSLRCSDAARRKAWPNYQRCLDAGRVSSSDGKQRSPADLTFCCIAINLFKRTPEETAAKLMEVSSKAKENGGAYALQQAMRAAAKVEESPIADW